MKMKHLLGLIFVGACFSTVVVASEKELSIEEQAAQILKESDSPWSDSDEQKPVRSPAAGFWQCHGTRLHMGVDLNSWTNLDTAEVFAIHEKPTPTEDGRGTDYSFSSMSNPAYVEYFVVDKSGKKLSIRDRLKFSKLYPCKREK